jgi:hypothetical protein
MGRVLAVFAIGSLVLLLIVAAAFFIECASWGQCPPI